MNDKVPPAGMYHTFANVSLPSLAVRPSNEISSALISDAISSANLRNESVLGCGTGLLNYECEFPNVAGARAMQVKVIQELHRQVELVHSLNRDRHTHRGKRSCEPSSRQD